MTCPKCKSEQPDNAKFCSQCSEPLTQEGKKAVRSKVNPFVWAVLALVLVGVVARVQSNLSKAEIQKQQAIQRAMAMAMRPQSHSVTIVNSATAINAGAYSWYTFVVPNGANTISVNGHFTATGGSGNDIECYVLDDDGFVNFKNGHPANTYFNSGRVTQAKVGAVLGSPGTYYILLDNRFSLFAPKAVQIEATLSYIQ